MNCTVRSRVAKLGPAVGHSASRPRTTGGTQTPVHGCGGSPRPPCCPAACRAQCSLLNVCASRLPPTRQVLITKTDAYGRTTNATALLRVLQSLPPVTATITGPPAVSIVAGAGTTLDARNSSCLAGNCTYAWLLQCGARPAMTWTGATASFTAGPGAKFTLNTEGSAGMNCSVQLTVTDANNATSTANATLAVSASRRVAVRVWD